MLGKVSVLSFDPTLFIRNEYDKISGEIHIKKVREEEREGRETYIHTYACTRR